MPKHDHIPLKQSSQHIQKSTVLSVRPFSDESSKTSITISPKLEASKSSFNFGQVEDFGPYKTGSDQTDNKGFLQQGVYNPKQKSQVPLATQTLPQNDSAIQMQQSSVVVQRMPSRHTVLQRDEEAPSRIGQAADVGDIGGAILEVYEACNGDDSASSILKAVTELSGNWADTTGGMEDVSTGASKTLASASMEGAGMWARMVGGATNLAEKGSALVGSLAGYGTSALSYASSFGGYGSASLQQLSEATAWLGGWAKSASDLVSPYQYYTGLLASSAKAAAGVSDGWGAGYVVADLDKLVKNGSDSTARKAAKLIFDIAWWKRLEGYSKGAVGAIESGAAVFFGPLSKGISTVMTKGYETGWSTYVLRAIGSSCSSSIYSNAQVAQQANEDKTALMATVGTLVASGKIKDIVGLCKAADALGISSFTQAVLAAFDHPPQGSENRYKDRKQAFESQLKV